jgi:hypothetical protein
MQYTFTFVNAFQGCLIFACHILLKKEGRQFFWTIKRSISSLVFGSLQKNTITRGMRQTEKKINSACVWRIATKGNPKPVGHMRGGMPNSVPLRVDRRLDGADARPTAYDNFSGFQDFSVYDDASNANGRHTAYVNNGNEFSVSSTSTSSAGSSRSSGSDVLLYATNSQSCDGDVRSLDSHGILHRWLQPRVSSPSSARKSSGMYIHMEEECAEPLPTMVSHRSLSYTAAIGIG